jgi:hypothetical protein
MRHSFLLAVAVLLSACGSDKHDAAVPTPAPLTPPAVAVGDQFVASVNTVVAASSDSTEPQAVDSAATSAPEDSEPVAVAP